MTALKRKAVSGIKWSAVSQISRQATQLLTTVILARLLSPSDFGLLGMAMVVIGFINIFKDLGTSAAIVQRKELSDSLLSSVFWVNICFGVIAAVILSLSAPLIGLFYQEMRVVAVLRVFSIIFIVSAFGILHQSLSERSLSFDSLARLEIASVVVGSVTGIGLALTGAGVWSLVLQSLATASLTTIFLWLSHPWRPQLIFSWEEVKTVNRFSLNLTGFGIFNYFARNADYLLVGRYLGTQELGYYTLAYRILVFPLQNISAVIGRVMYPVFSTMQDDNERIKSAYLKVAGSISLFSFPLMMGILATAKPFVLTFFGDNWMSVIPLIVILAPVGMLQSIGTTVGAIYQAKGRTDWMFRWGIGSGTLAVAAFVIGLPWGIAGVAAAYAIATLILLYPSFAIPFQLIDLSFFQLLKVLMAPLLSSGLMFLVLIGFNGIFSPSLNHATMLASSVILGGAVYGAASWTINRRQILELWDLNRLNGRDSYGTP